MSTTVQTETLRTCIEGGGRGDFARALLALHDVDLATMTNAYNRARALANSDNLQALDRAWFSDYGTLAVALRLYFPGLRVLDELHDNPHEIPLRGEQS